MNHRTPWLIFLILGSLTWPAMAEHRWVGFSELVHRAHVIFDGRVIDQVCWESDDGKTISTDVTFDLIDLVHADPKTLAHIGETITITMPGGTVGPRTMTASDGHHFEHGQRILACVRVGTTGALSSIVGGDQGVFVVRERGPRHEPIPTKSYHHGILGIQDNRIHVSPKIDRLERDLAYFHAPMGIAPMLKSRDHNPDPTPIRHRRRGALLSLPQFKDAIHAELGQPMVASNPLSASRSSRFPLRAEDAFDQQELLERSQPLVSSGSAGDGRSEYGDVIDLCVCGSQDLPMVFEYWEGAWWHEIDLKSMSHFSRFVSDDMYHCIPSDGMSYPNGDNEILGICTDEFLAEGDWEPLWNEPGNSAVGRCWIGLSGCDSGDIWSTDVGYNGYLNHTNNHQQFLESNADVNIPGLSYLPGTSLHEFGHTWGLMSGESYGCDETYSYTSLSVMAHGSLLEQADGIHAADAYFVRANHDDQVNLIPVADIGCEQYSYSEGQAYDCRINGYESSAVPVEHGDQVTISNILFESMSSSFLPVTLAFYASRDRHLDEDEDALLGAYSYDDFLPYGTAQGDFTVTIPESMGPGEHHVIMR
ncbi:MAG: hypothetical protein MK089_12945, partial [Phycisphaerales bacterium]|nr:hypothetical protein [Phycisphaerales bacterium]